VTQERPPRRFSCAASLTRNRIEVCNDHRDDGLNRKAGIVTGAGRGIGRATAIFNWRIRHSNYSARDEAQLTEVAAKHESIHAIIGDGVMKLVEHLIDETVRRSGRPGFSGQQCQRPVSPPSFSYRPSGIG